MSQYEKVFRIVGPIIGFALLYYVLTGAAGFLQQGQLALANQAATAAEAAAAGDGRRCRHRRRNGNRRSCGSACRNRNCSGNCCCY